MVDLMREEISMQSACNHAGHRSKLARDGRPGWIDAAGRGFRGEGRPFDMDAIDPDVESVLG
jgi:hypothetical protein